MDLTFTNRELADLCNSEAELVAWAGDDAVALQQLLNELDCADTLGLFEELPHVLLVKASAGLIASHDADEAGVLLEPEVPKSKTFRAAEAAVIIAVAVGAEEFNPEGATWPRASATSRTTR